MSLNRRALVALVSMALVSAAGCASGGSGSGSAGDRNELTREEIAEIQVANLYDAVDRLRPRWLLIRSQRSMTGPTEIVVFMNRSLLGGPEVLRQFNPADVIRLRYLDGPSASAQLNGLSGRAIEGAIIIEVS
jgi:hypothetical protein